MNGVRYRVKLERNFGKIGVQTPCTPPPSYNQDLQCELSYCGSQPRTASGNVVDFPITISQFQLVQPQHSKDIFIEYIIFLSLSPSPCISLYAISHIQRSSGTYFFSPMKQPCRRVEKFIVNIFACLVRDGLALLRLRFHYWRFAESFSNNFLIPVQLIMFQCTKSSILLALCRRFFKIFRKNFLW